MLMKGTLVSIHRKYMCRCSFAYFANVCDVVGAAQLDKWSKITAMCIALCNLDAFPGNFEFENGANKAENNIE